mgnify:CR=1 FL=1
MLAIDELIEEHGLLSRVLRYKTDESETEAVTALADTIATLDKFEESPTILAKALADGLHFCLPAEDAAAAYVAATFI